MKRSTIIYSLLLTLMLSALGACEGLEENYSSNPTYRLSFSVDTLAFDTVFSEIGSSTRPLMIYNPHQEALNIESIMLSGGESTGFRINVDGRKGNHFQNVGILSKDSLYVFVEVTVNPNGAQQPLLIQDSILFTVNGIRQSVRLEAYGQDVHLHKHGLTIAKDTTLPADRPYLIYDSLVVAPHAHVRIEPGAIFYMHDKANWIVYGTLEAIGKQEAPITIRGDRLDDILNDILPYDRTPGQWGGIFIKEESFGNHWEHLIVRNGTTGILCELSTPDQSKLILNHAHISNMGDDLFTALNCDISAWNTEFSNAGGSIMTLAGGKYAFAHCTLVNYMSLTDRSLPAAGLSGSRCLYLLNNATIDGHGPYPITQAYFDNCLIDGSFEAGDLQTTGEIVICSDLEMATIERSLSSDFNYHFNHCVLKAKEVTLDHFQSVLFIQEPPAYRMLGGEENKYQYDFRPSSATMPAVGKADKKIAARFPTDRYGVDRLNNPYGPTIGAYEYVSIKQ